MKSAGCNICGGTYQNLSGLFISHQIASAMHNKDFNNFYFQKLAIFAVWLYYLGFIYNHLSTGHFSRVKLITLCSFIVIFVIPTISLEQEQVQVCHSPPLGWLLHRQVQVLRYIWISCLPPLLHRTGRFPDISVCFSTLHSILICFFLIFLIL